MPCTVKGKPLEKVCLGLPSETFAGDIIRTLIEQAGTLEWKSTI